MGGMDIKEIASRVGVGRHELSPVDLIENEFVGRVQKRKADRKADAEQ